MMIRLRITIFFKIEQESVQYCKVQQCYMNYRKALFQSPTMLQELQETPVSVSNYATGINQLLLCDVYR